MQVTFPVRYHESYLPSPRHRLLRDRYPVVDASAEVREVTVADAPVAFRRTSPFSHSRGKGSYHYAVDGRFGTKHVVNYHWFEGRLYAPLKHDVGYGWRTGLTNLRGERAKKPPKLADASDIRYNASHGYYDTHAEAEDALRRAMAEYLLIDGVLCLHTVEPTYVIMTFGLGHNHGLGWGTSLDVTHGFNPNIATECYYRIDDEARVNRDGLAVALHRGDTKAKPHFTRRLYDRFEILIPEAVQFTRESRKDKVDDFTTAVHNISNSGLPPVVAGLALLAAAFR
jgi:hypothetical protein